VVAVTLYFVANWSLSYAGALAGIGLFLLTASVFVRDGKSANGILYFVGTTTTIIVLAGWLVVSCLSGMPSTSH
jgi:hypothetical protein